MADLFTLPLFLPTLGPLEVGVVFVVVLILFGPGKLPDVFRAFGDGVRQFKDAANKPSTLPEEAKTVSPPSTLVGDNTAPLDAPAETKAGD